MARRGIFRLLYYLFIYNISYIPTYGATIMAAKRDAREAISPVHFEHLKSLSLECRRQHAGRHQSVIVALKPTMLSFYRGEILACFRKAAAS